MFCTDWMHSRTITVMASASLWSCIIVVAACDLGQRLLIHIAASEHFALLLSGEFWKSSDGGPLALARTRPSAVLVRIRSRSTLARLPR